jgi:photosystem II stability/assembly factor-like uncharacterized protein
MASSTDGGLRWKAMTVPSAAFLLSAVSCASAATCFVTGTGPPNDGVANGLVLATTDGGATWAVDDLPSGSAPTGISCPTANDCLVVEGSGQIFATTDGGENWGPQSAPSGVNALQAVSCVNSTDCYAAGEGQAQTLFGAILSTTDGGADWSLDTTPSGTDFLDGLSCSGPTTCVAVANGTYPVMSTTDGSTWTASPLPPPTTYDPYSQPEVWGGLGVSCLNDAACVVVGADMTGGLTFVDRPDGGGSRR